MADTWQLKAVLSANSAGMVKALTEAGKVAKTTRKYLLDVGKAAGNFTGRIGLPVSLLSGLAAGFSFSAIKNAVTGFTDMGESVYRGALRAGMGVEEYQRMKYVAEQAGVGVESLENSVGKLNLNIGKAAAGKGKPVSELMQRLGISMRDSNDQVRAGVDLLPQLADAFKRNENPAVRARMGMALFGKSWAEMAPLLMEGSEGITASLERMKRLKGVISPEDIRGAKELGDKFKDLEIVTKGFQMTIAKELVPVLSPLIEDIIQWAGANRQLVAVKVKEFVRELVAGMRQIDWQGIIQGARDFGTSLGKLVDFVGGAKNALIALVVVMNAQTIMAVFGLIGALGKLGFAFLAMAAKAYIASNAALLSLFSLAKMAFITGGAFGVLKTVLLTTWTWIYGVGKAIMFAGTAFRGLWALMLANPLGVIIAIGTAAYLIYKNWDTLKEWFSGFFDWVGEKFSAMLGWVGDVARAAGRVFGFGSDIDQTAYARAATSAGRQNSAPPVFFGSDQARPSLLGPAGKVKADGKIDININGLPQGARVDQKPAGDIPFNVNAGYRSDALGMAW